MDSKRLAWLQRVVAADSMEGLQQSLSDIVGELGYRHFIYRSRFAVPGAGFKEIAVDGRPREWREWCLRHQINSQSDPLWSRALRQVTPILWREVTPGHAFLFASARDHGMATGVTHPLHALHGDWSAMSLVKDHDTASDQRNIDGAIAAGQLLICFVHDAVSRLVKAERDSPVPANGEDASREATLSDRELECLQFCSSGMTAPQTADRLHISENTVIFHLKNARRKLGTANSRHAVVKAIRLRIIQPN